MNDISNTRYVIIKILDKKLIIGTINHWNKNGIYGNYMVVEKEGFSAFKNNNINMLLF